MKIFTGKKIITGILTAAFWLLLWQAIYMIVSNDLLVPAPFDVAKRMVVLAAEKEFWRDVALSILRIFTGFACGIVLGSILAFVSCNKTADSLLSPLKNIIKATPVASFIMLAWIWLKRDSIPIFISMLMVLPLVWGNVSAGIKSVDKKNIELAKIYDFGKKKTFLYITLPSVFPHFVSALYTGAGFVWKAGIAAEVLCQPKHSIGYNLYNAKNILDTLDVFAWTTVIIIISLCLEKALKAALEKKK